MTNWLIFRPIFEWLYSHIGRGPEPFQYVDMTNERRHWIERAYPG